MRLAFKEHFAQSSFATLPGTLYTNRPKLDQGIFSFSQHSSFNHAISFAQKYVNMKYASIFTQTCRYGIEEMNVTIIHHFLWYGIKTLIALNISFKARNDIFAITLLYATIKAEKSINSTSE